MSDTPATPPKTDALSGHRLRHPFRVIIAAALFCAAGVAASLALPRDALRATVDVCVAMMARTHLPLPCSRLQGPPGFEMAILDPPIPGKHRLVVPVAPVTGIEDEGLRGPAGAAYFALAWQTALDRAGGDRASAGLAVNSARVRSQDQLHFHADCVSDRDKQRLRRLAAGQAWRRAGRFWVLLARGTPETLNPFALIREVPALAQQLRDVNLGVFGAGAPAGSWVIVADIGMGSFERFLTSDCRR